MLTSGEYCQQRVRREEQLGTIDYGRRFEMPDGDIRGVLLPVRDGVEQIGYLATLIVLVPPRAANFVAANRQPPARCTDSSAPNVCHRIKDYNLAVGIRRRYEL